jgi:DNA-binding XRE family transcriptional regulator
MNNLEIKRKAARMIISGKRTQKEIANAVGVCRRTIQRWNKEMNPTKLLKAQNNLIGELLKISKNGDYKQNGETINRLIKNIGQINELINKQLK